MIRHERAFLAPSTHIFCSLLLALPLLLDCTLAYQNFTVGDDIGWTFPTKNVIDYQKWATGKNFSLGDFLNFNYPQLEHDVIVTYNKSVYTTCDILDSNDNDYEVWGQPGNSSFSAIPLVETGMNYFFCGTNDGDHCKGGMKFAINVTHGEGLPASLMIPPPAPEDDSTPDSSPDTSSGSPSTAGTPDNTPSDDNPSLAFALRVEFRIALLLPLMILAGIFI